MRLKLKERPKEEILRRMAEVDRARKGQPKRKSAGCAFKNPRASRRDGSLTSAASRGFGWGTP